MGWLKNKIFGPKKTRDEELAENMYSALVLDGGPSGQSDGRIGAVELGIPIGKLEQFSQKRQISLEAMLFVAAQIETADRSQKLQELFGEGQIHPFAMQMGVLIASKWNERGIEIEQFEVGERCFDEVEQLLEKPFKWGRNWLDDFFEDPEQSGEHYILWTDQWLKEFKVMRDMVKEYA